MINKLDLPRIAVLLVMVWLTACGGGGGGSDTALPPPTPKLFGTAELIEINNAGNASSPQITMDANDNALAVWSQSDGTRYNIWANRYTTNTGWGVAELIETDNAGDVYTPQITTDANGNALAVWRQDDGTRYNIWANRFE